MSDKEPQEGQETPPASQTTTTPPPPPPAEPDPEPTLRDLLARQDSLEAKLDRLIEQGASKAAIAETQEQLEETQDAILETPASTGESLEPATTETGQASDAARSEGQTGSSSQAKTDGEGVASGEPLTPGNRKRKRALGRRSRQ